MRWFAYHPNGAEIPGQPPKGFAIVTHVHEWAKRNGYAKGDYFVHNP